MARREWAVAGYIVTGADGAMTTCAYEDGATVLCYGDHAHLFPNRKAAMRAVDRSRIYAEKHNLTAWDTRYKIVRVVSQKGRA